MSNALYPLKFDPVFQYRIWGGRNLEKYFSKPLPAGQPVGEAWILSDRKDFSSRVVNGSLQGRTLTELMRDFHREIMGKRDNYLQFPLLLKFLDCRKVLSVQVHPSGFQADEGESGKTEAWVVLETSAGSRIYAGLKRGTTRARLMQSLAGKKLPESLYSFVPEVNDGVFIRAGTVHTVQGAVIFEVQQNSDITYRLYDWDRTDPRTKKPRSLQVEKALESIDFNQVEIGPVIPVKSSLVKNSEILFDSRYFKLWRIRTEEGFAAGFPDEPAILVCLEGSGKINFQDSDYSLEKGEVILLPASIGPLVLQPGPFISLLQITVPEKEKEV